MNTVFSLLMVAIIISCVLLIILIMAQNPKGGGLSGTFGGASTATFGVQRTNDFMEKATWVLSAVVIALIFLSVVLSAKPTVQAPPKKQATSSQAPVKPKTPAPQAKPQVK